MRTFTPEELEEIRRVDRELFSPGRRGHGKSNTNSGGREWTDPQREAARRYYHAHKDHILEMQRKRRAENKEQYRAYYKKYYKKHYEEIHARAVARYQAHREEIREYQRQYREKKKKEREDALQSKAD